MFPTVVETGLSFLLQGPFVTTPNRDNVPAGVEWNRYLMNESGRLLAAAISGLQQMGAWDISALCCMPLQTEGFEGPSQRFEPLHRAFQLVANDVALIPDSKGGFLKLGQCVLGEPADLLELLSFEDLAVMFPRIGEPGWVNRGITRSRSATAELYRYLERRGAGALNRPALSRHLTLGFLESRSDVWMQQLYEFYSGVEAKPGRPCPFLRLSDGTQVVFDPDAKGAERVYRPGPVETGLLTVKREVVNESARAQRFLRELGLEVATLVRDVCFNVLAKYARPLAQGEQSDEDYLSDLKMVSDAHQNPGAERRSLENDLRSVYFVRSFDCGTGQTMYRRYRRNYPYAPTTRLQRLFEGVSGVALADRAGSQLWSDLGLPVTLSVVERKDLSVLSVERRQSLMAGFDGADSDVSAEDVSDFSLLGCRDLFQRFAELPFEEAAFRAGLLWECLGELPEALPSGTYSWKGAEAPYSVSFRSEAVDLLHREPWVPVDGRLLRVGEASLEDVGWQRSGPAHSSLQFRSDEGTVPETLNERQGRQVEDVVRQMFIAEGFEVDRTGTGSDWSARYRGREWLLEVKSTVGAGFVEVTSAQAQTGLERSDDFVLCVVSGVLVVAGDVDRQSVEENVRFVFDGKEVFGAVGNELERALGALTESLGREVSLDYDYSAVRVRVASSLWERLGVDFDAALARMRS